MGLTASGTGGFGGGSMGGTGTQQKVNMRTGGKTVQQVKKLQDAPRRLLKEVDILEI
jgi:hypothetical protein